MKTLPKTAFLTEVKHVEQLQKLVDSVLTSKDKIYESFELVDIMLEMISKKLKKDFKCTDLELKNFENEFAEELENSWEAGISEECANVDYKKAEINIAIQLGETKEALESFINDKPFCGAL